MGAAPLGDAAAVILLLADSNGGNTGRWTERRAGRCKPHRNKRPMHKRPWGTEYTRTHMFRHGCHRQARGTTHRTTCFLLWPAPGPWNHCRLMGPQPLSTKKKDICALTILEYRAAGVAPARAQCYECIFSYDFPAPHWLAGVRQVRRRCGTCTGLVLRVYVFVHISRRFTFAGVRRVCAL